ncbi:protein outspread isoform X1 [Hippocampus comes]|uniref:protein outspread isoform X1 n=1 Tax=Hippocampus comes TaxID=109280 RepID=UPI00094F36F5|nr:PREDICTED: protein outspread-like isoform X1 [Hippocampus comes]
MSTAKENSCRKFQANFFNKSKCQNCFKPRELHLLTDQDLTQAKPIYGGWLCLAPEGTDFDNPMQRSRKWQRRFFVLYEHGCLRFALDESPSTLPQGTVNMNLCMDVVDAEPKTGQKNSLCIITPEQEYFIRGENKEIINGWTEQLVVYPRTNKQNQKKKRKVEPTTSQEPGPAKVAVTGSGIPEAEKVPDSSSIIWQEELNQREAEGATVWAPAELPLGSPPPHPTGECRQGSDAGSVNGDEVDQGSLALHGSVPQPPSDLLSPTGSCSSLGGVPRCLSPAPSDPFPSGSSLLSNGSHISGSVSSLDSDASGSTVTSTESHPAPQRGNHSYSHHDTPRSRRLEAEARKAEKRSRFRSPERHEREAVLSPERSRSGVIEKLEALELENAEKMEVEESGRSGAREGRSEHRRFHREGQNLDFTSSLPPLRRAKSLDRRTTDSVMTPDLLNFKKGWMVKLDEQGQWKKSWFVLTDHSLRYYKDSIAEEASDLDGEIDLSTCYNVTEYQAQRNYGFQIQTQEGVYTLSAMTAGIRRNWIQAVMKNVRPSTAPDVASSTDDHASFSPLEGLVRPDVTQDSPSSETSSVERESTQGIIKSRARERRREGRSKTFDWAEFRPIAQALAQQRAQEAESLQADLGELERSRRREERRKRYESVTSSAMEHSSLKEGGRMDFQSTEKVPDSSGPQFLERHQKVEEVIEQHWRQVEKTPIREERRVPLPSTGSARETVELEHLLDNYKQGMEELKAQLEGCHQQLLDSNKHKQELELQLRTALEREQDIRAGYISPLEHHLGLEADVTPQMKRPELVSPQAQSLTKKYQETKELLKLQELKKRNMQAQLGLSLSHHPLKEPHFSEPPKIPIPEGTMPEPVQQTVSFLLLDSTEAGQELHDLTAGKSLTVKELTKLLKCHTLNQETSEKQPFQKVLETWKCQQEIEHEMMKKSLARAGETIREYESRLLNMDDLVQKQSIKGPFGPLSRTDNHSETKEQTIGMLTQRIEILTSENGALKQKCQEIVNQLTEADREIDRLKAELIGRQCVNQHHLVTEEMKRLKADLAKSQANAIDRDYFERELNEKSLRLREALTTIEDLGSILKDTEKKLQLREATLKGLGFQADCEDEARHLEQEQLKELLEASQAKLFDTEAALHTTQRHCVELESSNRELIALQQKSEEVNQEKLREVENQIVMLQEKLEMRRSGGEKSPGIGDCVQEGAKHVNEGILKQVVDEVEKRSEAANQVLDMLPKIDVGVEKMLKFLKSTLCVSKHLPSRKEGLFCKSQKNMRLVLEAEFLSQILCTTKIKPEADQLDSGNSLAQEIAHKRLTLLIGQIYADAEAETDRMAESDFSSMYNWLDDETNSRLLKELTETLKAKAICLEKNALRLQLAKDDDFDRFTCGLKDGQSSEYLLDALQDACMSYVIIRLRVQHEKEFRKKQTKVDVDGFDCPNCPELRKLAKDLQTQLADLHSQSCDASDMPETSIHAVGEPMSSAEKTCDMTHQDMVAKYEKELREVKDRYEQETDRLRQEIAEASETLCLRSEENAREMDSLTNCMEDLKKKHELERINLMERFDEEMEALRRMVAPSNRNKASTAEEGPLHGTPGRTSHLKECIQELLTQVSVMTEEMRRREEQGEITTLRLKYEKDLENLKATCERGFAAMEESHQKVIDELHRKHQRELENLQEEKERLLAEETAATISAIEAMKNAHRNELERELDKARKANSNAENADMDEMRRGHEEELCSFQREIEVLSEQYSQKCLENAHLAQALEAERQALRQCQRENQELNAHNQELNNRLAAEITKMRSMTSEDGVGDTNTIQGKELYELEVMLRVKESEVQYLKQEINSLKDELQAAQRDKKYATDKYKDIYTELSIVKAKAERDLGRLRDQLQLAHEALGEPSLEQVDRGGGYDIMKSKSNPDILKMAAAAAKRSERTMRSKSLKEGLTPEQRLHLFENKDTKEF